MNSDASTPTAADEPASCGEGLAAQAPIPRKIAAYLQALADTLEAHVPTIDAGDPAGQAERDAYRTLVSGFGSIVSDLEATAKKMRDYRDLEPAQHDTDTLAEPARLAPFVRMVELEAELGDMLTAAAERNREMLGSGD